MRVDRGRKGGSRGTAVAHNLVIGLLVLVIGGALPAAGLRSGETSPAVVSQSWPASVAVVGDSLIHQSIGEISDDLSSVGIRATVFGDPGHPLTSPSIVDRIAQAAADPAIRVVVIATASNDNLANARRAREVGEAKALAEYRQLVESALASLGGRCAVLVDARAASSRLYEPEFAPRTDGELRRISTERPDTVLVDWSAISAPHADDWFVADELHFAIPGGHEVGRDRHDAGAEAYAAAITAGVASCSSRV